MRNQHDQPRVPVSLRKHLQRLTVTSTVYPVDKLAIRHHDAFESFIQANLLGKKRQGARRLRAARVTGSSRILLGGTEEDAYFRFWVKSREFKLLDYPALDLQNILCVSSKTKVCVKHVSHVSRMVPIYCTFTITSHYAICCYLLQDESDITLLGAYRCVAFMEDF